jgi:hypothetical protein
MGFSRQKLSGADIERVKRYNIIPKFGVLPVEWIIDRNRDAFLVCVGGRRGSDEIPGEYAFVSHGQVAKFEAFVAFTKQAERSSQTEINLWEVNRIRLWAPLIHEADDFLTLISEAIAEYSASGPTKPGNVIRAQIKFATPPIHVVSR